MGAGHMSEVAQVLFAVGAAASGIGAVFLGLARLRMADAWKTWAGRCDPMNPNFGPSQPSRKL